MDPSAPTPTASSTVTSSSPTPPPAPLQLLQISLISAQDSTPVTKSMRTYAMAWISPNRKYPTRTDYEGRTHPTWNEKFTFRLDRQLLTSDDAAITVDIYALSWLRDVLVGTVKVLISDLLSPPNGISLHNHPKNMRFVALQVRRPSGTPQGILNMGIALLDTSERKKNKNLRHNGAGNLPDETERKDNDLSMPQQKNEMPDDEKKKLEEKINLWRLQSVDPEVYDEDFPSKPLSIVHGSVCNSSIVNGSELCSDIGPSASIVAAELAKNQQPPSGAKPSNQRVKLDRKGQAEETGSSILEDLTLEEARAKGFRIGTSRERRRKEVFKSNHSDMSSVISNRRSRRNSDGGLFSCFGNAYGFEFRITCGANNNPSSNKSKLPKNSYSRGKNRPLITDHANSV